jgi:hypothetical protein
MMNPILIKFGAKSLSPPSLYPEFFFKKIEKNRCFMKNTTTDHIFAKSEFLDKNTATD